jgi:hypothetical protein
MIKNSYMKWAGRALGRALNTPTPKLRRFLRGISAVASMALTCTGLAAPGPAVLDESHASVRAVIAVQNKVTHEMMKEPEILGTAAGLDANGAASLVIFVDKHAKTAGTVLAGLPANLGGVPVVAQLTEKFRAYPGKGHGHGGGGSGGGTSHTAKQTAPIQLGTSGGWRFDTANGFCCGGTLGSLIQVNGIQYIMSNYHVMESDIVPGGNGRVATTGDGALQPGLIDVGCDANSAQNVGTLQTLSSLPDSNVDVGVAMVISGMVRTDGAILEIGTLSSQTASASIGKAVKKSGRTTGLSRSNISSLNATISVTYENECAGGTAFTKTYTGQIIVNNSGTAFLNSGDSGSLMVEDVTTSPRAVGLLYAGSSSLAVANPIDQVLQFVGSKLGGTATMVGN